MSELFSLVNCSGAETHSDVKIKVPELFKQKSCFRHLPAKQKHLFGTIDNLKMQKLALEIYQSTTSGNK